ncbi:MAG: electron transport complex subunit RsxC, partial [Betaproteobacteria bacterium]|nr:electron transport complex subunit RsxC [Betaproteobacteria bacterium]
MPNSALAQEFQGGIVIANNSSGSMKIIQAPLPDSVILPLQQRIGDEAVALVAVGDEVLTGQLIAETTDYFCTPIHATISGVISAIDKQIIPHKSGLKSNCISIKSDGKDEWISLNQQHKNFLQSPPEKLIDAIQAAGIVGLGGGGFPTHAKLKNLTNCQTIIINGTECEPGIMCDDALMQNHPLEVISGVEILLHICAASRAIIAIEDDKPAAFSALQKCNKNQQISIVKIPTKYTSGAEKLLIKSLLNIEIPSGSFASDEGIICQNVATVKAISDAIIEGKPLVSRVVTVTGSGVAIPQNYEVRLGAKFADIIAASKPNNLPHNLRMGGLMMGLDVENIGLPIGKISNCIFVNNAEKKPAEQPCIRCGQCNLVCPVGLLPQQLFWWSKHKNTEKAMDYNLPDCIECRCCDFVCPSHIPLAQHFVAAKELNYQQTQQQYKTAIAKKRFEFRQFRLERNA